MDTDQRIALLTSIEQAHSQQRADLDHGIADMLGMNEANPRYQSIRSITHTGLVVGTIATAGYKAMKYINNWAQIAGQFKKIRRQHSGKIDKLIHGLEDFLGKHPNAFKKQIR